MHCNVYFRHLKHPGERPDLRECSDSLPHRRLCRHPCLLSRMLWRIQGDQVDAHCGRLSSSWCWCSKLCFPQYFVVVLGLLVLIVVGTIIGMTQVTINIFNNAAVFSLLCPPFIFSLKPITNCDSWFNIDTISHKSKASVALKSWTNFKLEQCCTNVNLQGLDKLKDPFLDTLSNYDESRQTVVELTWDQTQTDVSLATSVHNHDQSDQSDEVDDQNDTCLRSLQSRNNIHPLMAYLC